MTDNKSIPTNQKDTKHIPAVAVVLACGNTSRFPEFANVKCKALLPFKGRPIVDYVSRALCNSQVEKVFVVHPQDVDPQKAISPHEKIVFVKSPKSQPTIVDSVMGGLENLFEFYGGKDIHPRRIFLVSCDIPLVTSRDFDALLNQAAGSDADFYSFVIRTSLLKKDYPERRFRIVHLNELGDNFSLQSIVLVHSRLFRTSQQKDSAYKMEICDSRGRSLNSLIKMGQDIRKHRHSVSGWVRLAYRIAGQCGLLLFWQNVFDFLRNSVTESKLLQAIYLTLHLRARIIESHSTTFSADVDNPLDLENVSQKAIPGTDNLGTVLTHEKSV